MTLRQIFQMILTKKEIE